MIEVLKYIDPLWYYNLKPKDGNNNYFLDYRKLSEKDKALIEYDSGYEALSLFDASYQAFKKGIITTSRDIVLNNSYLENIPLDDQYRFLRKYYHIGWSIYFMLMRITQFHNPIHEIKALLKSLSIKRYHLYYKLPEYDFDSSSLHDTYQVSIILPTLNRYHHLSTILTSISQQSVPAFEIIIVDQSSPANKDFYKRYQHLPLKIIYQEKKGQWYARNEAIKISKGDFLLFVDDDSQVDHNWIEEHLKCLLNFNSTISAGISINEGDKISPDKTIYHWAVEFDSGNAMVRRLVFEKIGLFDNTYNGLRMGDTEFGIRAYLNGFFSISNPKAIRYHIKTSSGGMRDWGSINSFKPMSFFGPRPDCGTLYLFNKYFSKKYLLSFLLVRIYLSFIPTRLKSRSLGKIVAFLLFFITSPYWIYNLAHNLSSVKKYQANIPFFD